MTVSSQPEWFRQALDAYSNEVANVIILHGDIHDYVEHPEADEPLRSYIGAVLSPVFTIARYSPDEGITFAGAPEVARNARNRFETVVGLNAAPSGPEDPISAALRAQSGGGAQDDGERSLPSGSAEALPLLAKFLRLCERDKSRKDEYGKRGLLIIDRLDLICPPADKGTLPEPARAVLSLLHRIGTDPDILRNGSMVIMLTPTLEEVHPDLRAASTGALAIEIPPPTYAQRLTYCSRMVENRELQVEIPIQSLAAQTAGLSRRHIETLGLRAEANDKSLTRAMIKAGKQQLFSQEYSDVLEIMEPDVDFDDVGGHELAKEWFRQWIVAPMTDESLREFVPLGATLMGPAGTGKTYLVRALAKATGLNCVLFRQGKLKGPYVGESERRLEKALKGLDALAPCLVFIDELDQGFRRLTGGSGSGGDAVEGNIFGRMLEYISLEEHRGQIVFIGATNRPDLIDPALKREGRLGDAKIPLLPPDSAEERAQVLAAQCRAFGLTEATPEILLEIGKLTDKRTQAELKGLVLKAKGLARILKMEVGQALREAVRRTRSSTAEVDYWTKLALAEANDIALVPERWRDRAALPITATDVPESLREAAGPYRRGSGDRDLGL